MESRKKLPPVVGDVRTLGGTEEECSVKKLLVIGLERAGSGIEENCGVKKLLSIRMEKILGGICRVN